MSRAHAAPLRSRRSLLFVPGAEPRKLERARAAGADTLILDLEDSVAPAQKTDARTHVAEALRAGGFGATEVAVRVNAPGTAYFEADLAAVIASGGRAIMLPKAESAAGVAAVAGLLQKLERERGDAKELKEKPGGVSAAAGEAGRSSKGRVARPAADGDEDEAGARLLLLIESPAGVADAVAIGRAAPNAAALCFGHADFSLQMGLAEADAAHGVVFHARCTVAIAARACGLAPIDSVFLAVRDETGFREDVALGLRLGFDGKLCIHPRQVEIANELYTPGAEQVGYALRVLELWRQAEDDARGVVTLDGKMIDAPIVAAQRRILERARRAGVLTAERAQRV